MLIHAPRLNSELWKLLKGVQHFGPSLLNERVQVSGSHPDRGDRIEDFDLDVRGIHPFGGVVQEVVVGYHHGQNWNL